MTATFRFEASTTTATTTPQALRAGKDAARGAFPARRAGAAGLSKPHIRTTPSPPAPTTAAPLPPAHLRWFPGASLVEINLPSHHAASPRPRKQKPRGRIKEWSAASRSRLKHTFGRLDRKEVQRAIMVTLTYPKECPAPEDHDVYKGHLHRFKIALRRRWPLCSGIWKLEFQARGAAHYHFMLFGLGHETLEALRSWTRKTWYRIAHNGDKNLGSACEKAEPVRSTGAMGYFAKYLGKGDQTLPGNFSGRYWGKINARLLPLAQAKELEVPPKLAAMIRRIARKKMQHDATTARWNRHLEHLRQNGGWELSRLQWQTAKAQHHGGAGRVAAWTTLPAMRHTEDGTTATFPATAIRLRYDRKQFRLILQQHPPPPRWKPRHNDRVRLLCDASKFIAQLARLHQPTEGGFRTFSRRTDC